MLEKEWTPKIVAFCCNWCSYAGADNAGVGRRQMPPNFRIIRTMCSARVDPEFVLRAFSKGADGVMVLGCHPADCHYIGGNYRARRRVALIRMVIAHFCSNHWRMTFSRNPSFLLTIVTGPRKWCFFIQPWRIFESITRAIAIIGRTSERRLVATSQQP